MHKSYFRDGDPSGFCDGIGRGSLKNTLSRTIRKLNSTYRFVDEQGSPFTIGFNIPYWQSYAKNRAELIAHYASLNMKSGVVAIFGYEYWNGRNNSDRRYAHWTVISKMANDCVYTFDSDGEAKRIPLGKIRVDDFRNYPHRSRPFNFESKSLFLVHRNGMAEKMASIA